MAKQTELYEVMSLEIGGVPLEASTVSASSYDEALALHCGPRNLDVGDYESVKASWRAALI